MEFKKYNANPKEWAAEGDCVVRALCTAENLDWLEVYDALYEIGRKKCRMQNSKKTYETFLEDQGWSKQPMPRHSNNTRYTVRELIDEYSKQTLVISVAHHLTCAKNGELIDTWNCSRKSVGNYWIKKE